MLGIIIFSVLTAVFLISVDRLLRILWLENKHEFEWLEYELKKKREKLDSISRENTGLRQDSEAVVALYDITKDICKTLGVENMLKIFKDYAGKFIGPGDYRLVKSEEELSRFPGYTTFALTIDKNTVGYLITDNVNEKDLDKFQILGHQLLIGIKRSYLYEKVQELAITDNLTQAYTRRYFMERLNEEVERSLKFKHAFSFFMLDIDHFKEYNDRYGHLVGDAVLREVAKILKENIRQVDFIGRYGGEELSIVLNETDKPAAKIVAERIRASFISKPVSIYDESLQITVSIGVSAFPEDARRPKDLIEKADKALYAAKEKGRNRVCVFGELD
ncbi:MAG: GGDEF domain-containing protein [Candidatus Omnitrophica bacterium]|nr:GGDEF domain-containing protein [Candidatus Omnitrophota bacterium]